MLLFSCSDRIRWEYRALGISKQPSLRIFVEKSSCKETLQARVVSIDRTDCVFYTVDKG